MFQRKPRRFKRRSNNRSHISHVSGNPKNRLGSSSFINGHARNNFRPYLSAEKLLEKYNSLAKEAMSSGDKTLSENYLQHADHFMRIIEDKNRNQNQNKFNVVDKSIENKKILSDNVEINQDQDKELKNKD